MRVLAVRNFVGHLYMKVLADALLKLRSLSGLISFCAAASQLLRQRHRFPTFLGHISVIEKYVLSRLRQYTLSALSYANIY